MAKARLHGKKNNIEICLTICSEDYKEGERVLFQLEDLGFRFKISELLEFIKSDVLAGAKQAG